MTRLLSTLLLIALATKLLGQTPYRANVVLIKVLPEHRSYCSTTDFSHPAFVEACESLGGVSVFQKFPNAKKPNQSRSMELPAHQRPVDITLIYEVSYESNLPVLKAADVLKRSGVLEYAEPAYIAQTLYVPNDDKIHRQWHLEVVRAFAAWDIEQGSEDMVIGVTDTGIDTEHPDLVDAIKYNEDDPIDGIDNDMNGYVDDYMGWNFYENNNDPDEKSWSHGTHVCGLAAASTDNALGVVGTGFKCKVLPIKCGDQVQLPFGYEGIVYGVENGASIINCSWGSTQESQFGHDIVKYAHQNDVVLTGGAGNNNNDNDFYPASYIEVLSVAATDSLNGKAIFSSFSYNVGIAAPGQAVWSTKNVETALYDYDNGTSMSAPIVAGAAALVRLRHPLLTASQVMAQLRETAYDIDTFANNEEYIDRLGSGMLDMEAALQDIGSPGVEMTYYELTDQQDELYVNGEELRFGIELTNHLLPTNALNITLESLSSSLKIVDGNRSFPALGFNGRSNNLADPFILKVEGGVEYNEEVVVRINISDGSYETRAYVRFRINPDYVNITVNNVKSTVSSHGLVGFANNARTNGLGFNYLDKGNMLYEAGLMIGHQNSVRKRVVDRIRGVEYVDRDFYPEHIIRRNELSVDPFYAQGLFIDSSAIEDEIGLRVRQTVRAFDDAGHRNYFMVKYVIENTSNEDLQDVYIGMFADWDIENSAMNVGRTAQGKKLGYVYLIGDERLSAGIQLLNHDVPFYSYLIDNRSDGTNGVSINDAEGFSSDEKYTTLTSNAFERASDEAGTDVSVVVSSGAYGIQAGDSIEVAFAIHGGQNPDELFNSADSAFKRYNGFGPGENVYSPFQFRSISPMPTSGNLRIDFDLMNDATIDFYLIDGMSRVVANLGSNSFYAGTNLHDIELPELVPGLYYLRLESDRFQRTLTVVHVGR